jgi:NTP pyrophosphatase (non-canonical NTP hydrolase)
MSEAMSDRLDDIITQLRAFVTERDWAQFHDPKNLAMAVASEAGELLAEYRWIASARADAWSSEQVNKQRVAMEAADVGISLLLLCDRVGIDLVEAISEKISINARNYPVDVSKGRDSRPDASSVY